MTKTVQQIITLITDASWCPQTRASGWAAWAKIGAPLVPQIKRAGRHKVLCETAREAELAALANGVYLVTGHADFQPEAWVIGQTDCIEAIMCVQGRMARVSMREALMVETIRACTQRIGRLDLRHVKGHTNWPEGRYSVNRWCDEEAKKHMRAWREELAPASGAEIIDLAAKRAG